MITHEEARKNTLYLLGKYDGVFVKLNDYINLQEQLQAEHEALKKDVARYFELSMFSQQQLSKSQYEEYLALRGKLSKVGKKE